MRGQLYLDPRHYNDGVHATLHIITDDLRFDLHLVIPAEQARDLATALTAFIQRGRATPS